MHWYDSASFYHIYPLGLTGAPAQNDCGAPEPRLRALLPWVDHIADLGLDALYIGPLFQSVGHGYETTDYRLLDSRLGTNDDLRDFVACCHKKGLRVVLDAVFNHTGRDFFAFRDLLQNREASPYRDWYRVDFRADNGYHDGLRYETWGGYELLAKLNLGNPAVRQYHLDTVRFWVEAFDIDGLRLDAADVLDFGFLSELRRFTDGLKPDFWLMGEVIHGEYGRWLDAGLHSVTNYRLHKALYSSHNDHNYFELAHTVEQLGPLCPRLYSFADNHDVERIFTRLRCKAHFLPVQVLLFTLPGLPSVYYGSEFAIEGRKERGSDASLRPALRLEDFKDNAYASLIRALAAARRAEPALQYGTYIRHHLTTGTFAFSRSLGDRDALVCANNTDREAEFRLPAKCGVYRSVLTGETVEAADGQVSVKVAPNGAVLLVPEGAAEITAVDLPELAEPAPAELPDAPEAPSGKALEDMDVAELQGYILFKLSQNGPLTDRMRREVAENVYPDSLRNWAKSFR